MDRSLFSKPSSSRRRFLSSSVSSSASPELPRWRSPSPMAASMIPPPIIQSTYGSPSTTLARSVVVEPPSPLQDRQSELEADLQFLLDAQAEGLVKGLEGGLHDDQASNGSTTPTAQSVRSASARQQRRLSRRKPGLRSARKGIHNAMLALSSLKDDELAEINEDVRDKERKLDQIAEWEKKKEGLQDATRSVDADEDAVRAQRLRQESDVLQEEINAVELQLADLKARHRKLVRQAAAVENSVQAKLASYTSSLRLLDEDVQKFLSLAPDGDHAQTTNQDGRTSMWQLPPKRRTLDMAKVQLTEERRLVLQQREHTEHEKTALDEGAAIWKDAVTQVTDFERRLRVDVSKLSKFSVESTKSLVVEEPQTLAELWDNLRQVTQTLESSFQLARDHNWNLLIAAIGAELDALKQGRQMLEKVLNPIRTPVEDVEASSSNDTGPSPGEEIRELDKSFENAMRRRSHGADSDPDPELMFSRHDTDTE